MFLIYNTVVLNPYSHITAYLKFQVRLIDMSWFDIKILHDLKIDNGIWQCVNSTWAGIFKKKFMVHGQYIRFATPLLASLYQK